MFQVWQATASNDPTQTPSAREENVCRFGRDPELAENDDRPTKPRRPSLFEDDDVEQPSSSKGAAPVKTEKDGLAMQYSPNRPHPSLEYPPLYFALKQFPWLFHNIKAAYSMRWKISYPLQRKVPFSPFLRKLKIRLTWGELLLLLPFFLGLVLAFVYTVFVPSVTATGHVSRTALIAAIGLAQRNSIITLLFGMPIDRTIVYHKLAARLAFLAGILHTIAFFIDPAKSSYHGLDKLSLAVKGQENLSGTLLMLCMTGITLTALPYVRHKCFEVFYFLHFVFLFGMALCALFHTGALVPCLAGLIWGADLIIRQFVMARSRYPREAKLRLISETVVELSFPKLIGFDYNPGQYLYIAVPDLSYLEFHPFSISSSPKQKRVTLHIRKAGDWTSALYELASKKKDVPILVEGPYGSLGVDLSADRYKMVMLFSGGIGITPMQSICDQLLHDLSKGRRELKRLKFVWIERDPVLMQQTDFVRRTGTLKTQAIDQCAMDMMAFESTRVEVDGRPVVDLASRILSCVPPGTATDEDLAAQYAGTETILDADEEATQRDGVVSIEGQATANAQETVKQVQEIDIHSKAETSFADEATLWRAGGDSRTNHLRNVLDLHIHLTAKDAQQNSSMPFVHLGRPDIKQLFLHMKAEAIANSERRVAVCVCAPQKLTHLCQKACIVYSDSAVRFDFHSEPTA